MNTKRQLIFRVIVEADNEETGPLSVPAEAAIDAIIDAISPEGWTVKRITVASTSNLEPDAAGAIHVGERPPE